MKSENQVSPLLRLLVAGACIVVIVAGIKAVASTLNIILLAVLLAQSISVLPNWLMRKRVSPGLSVLITVIVVIIGGIAVMSLLGTSIAGLIEKLPVYKNKLVSLQEGLSEVLAARGIDLSAIVPAKDVSAGRILQVAGALLGAFAQALGNGVLLLILVVFILLELAATQRKLSRGLYPKGSVVYRIEEINKDTRKFVGITALTGLGQAVLNVVILEILGIDFAITWGVLFFFLNFVPMFGFFMALVPPVLIALLDYGWQKALMVFVGWYAVNFVSDNIIRPKFLKQGFDVSFLLLILALIFWTWVLGPVGTVLAIPLSLTLRRIVAEYTRTPAPCQENTKGGQES